MHDSKCLAKNKTEITSPTSLLNSKKGYAHLTVIYAGVLIAPQCSRRNVLYAV